MTDEVKVPYGEDAQETATLLLAAAEELGLDAYVVRTSSDGVFYVPDEVASKAKVEVEDDESDAEAEEKKPAKKTAAKKSAAKK